jgi:hypothetical protein
MAGCEFTAEPAAWRAGATRAWSSRWCRWRGPSHRRRGRTRAARRRSELMTRVPAISSGTIAAAAPVIAAAWSLAGKTAVPGTSASAGSGRYGRWA